ncbi:hypothetical protein C8Q78DRAFT_172387 [Trametes maxima]|nr:hypothetical protein C8Q78DRAFT_172387 [Trametes maxima]
MSLAATDEYDSLPDPFEGVDFDQVPELCTPVPAPAVDDRSSDYDSYFDDMDPAVLDAVPHLGPVNPAIEPSATQTPAQSQTRAHAAPPLAAAPVPAAISRLRLMNDAARSNVSHPRVDSAPSSQYSYDELDDTVFLEVDEIERRTAVAPRAPAALANAASANAASQGPRASLSERNANVPNPSATNHQTQRGSFKRVRSEASVVAPTPSKRSKLGRVRSKEADVDLHASARKILETMGDELTCSICYELPTATHCTNPCGHSCCGECLLQWIKATPRKPKCPVCRTALDGTHPIIPNFALDSAVRHHVSALAATGHVEWQPQGQLYQSYMARKEASSTLAQRIEQWLTAPRTPRMHAPSNSQPADDWNFGADGDYVDSSDSDSDGD